MSFTDKSCPDILQQAEESYITNFQVLLTTTLTIIVINDHVADVLAEKNIKVHRTFCGHYMTSIDMAGFSISLMKLDDELKELLDAAADTPSLTIR